jgi:hypothetical protein
MLVDAGLDYAICSSYFDFMTASARQNTRAILLCEAILARLSTRAEETVPPHWVRAYCAIRRLLPPSPAILGYDPFTVMEAAMHGTHDIVRLRSGRLLLIDLAGEGFSFAAGALPAATSARLSPA